jgi:Ca-activated chloride channel family protein
VQLSTAGLLVAMLTSAPLAAGAQDPVQQQAPLVFRGGVDRVAVATVVRTKAGKAVTDLKADDFELIDSGQPRKIDDFRAEASPVSIALLADFSGSMDVAEKRMTSKAMAGHILSWLTPDTDQIGLFAFDKTLHQLAPLAPAPGNILDQFNTMRPFGATSLFDALAETSHVLVEQGGLRRAVVALTDGADNASKMTAEAVSGLASSIDVPVYIVVINSPLDRSGDGVVNDAERVAMMNGKLSDLAHWTGGDLYSPLGPAQDSVAARQIVSELRQQYLIVFAPDTRPGWHPIDIRLTHRKDLVVRARSGYLVQGRPMLHQAQPQKGL